MADPAPIFICYAGPDRDVAIALHRALRSAGANPLCDAVDLDPGDRWDEAIPAALRRAAIIAVLVTDRWPPLGEAGPGHYNSDEVALAIRFARRRERAVRVVPVVLDGADRERVPYGLNRIKEIETRSTELEPVATMLRRLAAGERAIRPLPADPLDAALTRRDRLRASGAPADAIASVEALILALKRARLHGRQPTKGLHLAGRWTLTDKLGRGGFAEVWKAWDERIAAHVALKILHGQFGDSAERRDRFFRGARQMAQLDHPHVVRVIEPEVEHDGWYFFVMEHLPGGDLERAVLAGGVSFHGASRRCARSPTRCTRPTRRVSCTAPGDRDGDLGFRLVRAPRAPRP